MENNNENKNVELVVEEYIRYCDTIKGLGTLTQEQYRTDLIKFAKLFNIKDLQGFINITMSDMTLLINLLKDKKVATKNKRIVTLKAFYKYLVEILEVIPKEKDIMNKIKCFKDKDLRQKIKILSDSEVASFMDNCKNLRDYAMFSIFLSIGLRKSEVINIKLQDLDLDNNKVVVHRKGGKIVSKPLTPMVVEAIKLYLKKFRRKKFPNCRYDNLFISNLGNPMSQNVINITVKNIARRAGINEWEKVKPHTLRHSCATHLIRTGTSVATVQKLLDHESIKTTQIYTHLDEDDVSVAILNNTFDFAKKENNEIGENNSNE